ncbi:type I-B CRISPR-associated endonuclease Cas1b [Hippea sp. KM1]|uniref:type I-B CRISPR-associated endonuclease Cas1b n=1 Tax=Hippea sp. KM1 TaxID=944481 RepID=UPI000688A671|nr:type I-B CRISPR-associated endonuclease Cas1b [Hippea sp. KM1]
MRNYYIFRSGRIKRKDNTIFFETQEGERIPLPINDIDSIYLFGEIDLNTKLLNFLSQNNIMVHFFNYYGFYTGTFYPKEFLNSGEVIVRQVEHYLDRNKRLLLAKEFVRGAIYGSIQNLKRYKHKLGDEIEKLTQLYEASAVQDSVEQLMGIEGNAKDLYYSTFEKIIEQDIDFKRRVKNPPDNMMNALISFVNSIIYSEILKEIYKTQLNPTISYLHEPGFRRFSLSLDVSG